VEIVTGREPAHAHQAHRPARGRPAEVARVVRDQGKGAIYVASEILEKKAT
jgi:hypothetical protein